MRWIKLLIALASFSGGLHASTFTVEIEDQTRLGQNIVPQIYVAFTAQDQNLDTALYLSTLPGEENRPVRNQGFTSVGVFLYIFERDSIPNAPFENGVTVRDLHHCSLENVNNIKIVVTSQGGLNYYLSLFIDGNLTYGPQVSTTLPMVVDPNSLSTSVEMGSMS